MAQSKWLMEMDEQYMAGVSNVFLVTGNVHDLQVNGQSFLSYVEKHYQEKGITVRRMNYVNGLQGEDYKGWSSFLDVCRREMDCENPVHEVILIQDAEFLFPRPQQGIWEEAAKCRFLQFRELLQGAFHRTRLQLILIAPSTSEMHPDLLRPTSRIEQIDISYPNGDERRTFITQKLIQFQEKIQDVWNVTELVDLTAGLTLYNIEDILLIALQRGGYSPDLIQERKAQLMRKEYGDVIELWQTNGRTLADFAGQETLKAYHRDVVIRPFREGRLDMMPKGLLYMGAPGTGKTYFASCLAGEAGMHFVEFRMAKILDKYVGEAERNLEKAFHCFRSLAPVGIFIDELDQVLQRGGSDHPVQSNLFGMFLAFLSEPALRGRVLLIAATNYPKQLDAALKRSGRFDKRIPFLLPSETDRQVILKWHWERQSDTPLDTTKLNTLGYTPAELEGVVLKAKELAYRRCEALQASHLEQAFNMFQRQQGADVEEMQRQAIDECSDLEFLVEGYR